MQSSWAPLLFANQLYRGSARSRKARPGLANNHEGGHTCLKHEVWSTTSKGGHPFGASFPPVLLGGVTASYLADWKGRQVQQRAHQASSVSTIPTQRAREGDQRVRQVLVQRARSTRTNQSPNKAGKKQQGERTLLMQVVILPPEP